MKNPHRPWCAMIREDVPKHPDAKDHYARPRCTCRGSAPNAPHIPMLKHPKHLKGHK